jgi:predicted nucleic acid-binding protein
MSYLFDTDAISELFRKIPNAAYARWVSGLKRHEQFTSAIVVAELYAGVYLLSADGQNSAANRHMQNLHDRVIPAITVLPFDLNAAEKYGQIRAYLKDKGTPLADMDMQIAATAIAHDLELVTGNVSHFQRIPDLKICRVLNEAKRAAL